MHPDRMAGTFLDNSRLIMEMTSKYVFPEKTACVWWLTGKPAELENTKLLPPFLSGGWRTEIERLPDVGMKAAFFVWSTGTSKWVCFNGAVSKVFSVWVNRHLCRFTHTENATCTGWDCLKVLLRQPHWGASNKRKCTRIEWQELFWTIVVL